MFPKLVTFWFPLFRFLIQTVIDLLVMYMQAYRDVTLSIVSFSLVKPFNKRKSFFLVRSLYFLLKIKNKNLWIFTNYVFDYRYASVIAMESTTKVDDEQWLAYWIIYSFLSLTELILQSLIEWIPIWYTVKLVFVAWLVLPQFQGAAFIYNRVVREQFKKHGVLRSTHSKPTKPNILHSIFPHRVNFLSFWFWDS